VQVNHIDAPEGLKEVLEPSALQEAELPKEETSGLEVARTELIKSVGFGGGAGDVDKIVEEMESLANQLGDLELREELSHELSTQGQNEIPGSGVADSAELLILRPSKANDASSEGSEQFFTPRDSLCYEEDYEGQQLEEAVMPRKELEEGEEGEMRSLFVTRVSPEINGFGEIYRVESRSERTTGRSYDSVLHTYQDFVTLREQLLLIGEELECLKPLARESCGNLEAFLNGVADSRLGETQAFLDFLKLGGVGTGFVAPSSGKQSRRECEMQCAFWKICCIVAVH